MDRQALITPALEAILQAPSLAVLAVDKQGCVILWSSSASSMYGWTESEVLGRFLPIVPEDDRQRVYERIQAELKGDLSGALDVRGLRKDGSLVDVNLWTAPLRDNKGEVIGILGLHVDISARKQAEGARQQAESELRRVLDAVSDCVYCGEFDSDGRFFYHYYSPAAERILGRPPLFFLAGPERWLSAVHPGDRPRLTQAFARMQSGELPSEEEEYRIVLPDGTIRWVRDSAVMTQEADGRRFVNGVVSDITARKQTEQALKESELELRRVLDAASDYFWSGDIDPEGGFRYRYYSPAVKEITGRPIEFYMLGPEQWMSTVHPEDRAHLDEISKHLRSGEVTHDEYTYRIILPDGTIRWVLSKTTVSPPVDGHRRVDGVVSDITARQQAEETLRESEERYRLMAEAIPQLAWKAAPQGEVIDCNGRWYEYTGQTPEESRGFGWKNALHPDDVGRVMQSVQKDVAGGGLFQVEYRLRRASDGSYRWHLARALPIKDKDGKITSWFGSAVDIEDQKRVQEQLEERVRERTAELTDLNKDLRESEAKYRSLVEQIPAVTYTAALEAAKTLYVSPQIEKTLGCTQSDLQKDPKAWIRQVHPDDLKRVMAEISRTRKTGEPFDCEYRMLHRNGKILWVRDRATVVHDETGRPIFVQGVMLDVTEHRQAEDTMRLQSTALEAAANAIVISDREGLIVWVNPAFTKLTGYEFSEVIGKDLRVLRSYQHDKAFYEDLWQTPLSGRVWHGEIINKRKDGSLYTEEETITPVRDAAGKIAHFIFIKQDITEWKLAEESRRHLAAIVESSEDGIVSADLKGIITSWNAASQKLYNYAPHEMLGRSVSILVPHDRKGEIREIQKKVQCGERIQHYETVRLKKGGIPVDVSITVSPIKNDAGKVVGISAITRDISEKKELEKAVVEAGSREQRRIGLDLHDGLCQQLTGIGFLWKAIVQRKEVRALLDAAAVREMSQLITKTIGEGRDLARVLCPVEFESNDLGVALKNLGLSMERLSAASFVVRCQQPVLLADKTVATHLYRIAQEAISNAMRHGKATRVWVHLTKKKKGLTLRIKDNGSGFSKRRGLNEGIGMRSMRYRAQAIGGSLTIESKRGAGTTVTCVYTQPNSGVGGRSRRRTAG